MAWSSGDRDMETYRRAMELLLKTYDGVNRSYESAFARSPEAARTVMALYAMKMNALANELVGELNRVQRQQQQQEMDVDDDDEPVWMPPPTEEGRLCLHSPEYEKMGVSYMVVVAEDQFRQQTGRGTVIPACTFYSIEAARILIEQYGKTPGDVTKFKTAICNQDAWKNLVIRANGAYKTWERHFGPATTRRGSVTTPTSLEIRDDRVRRLFGDNTRVLEGLGDDYNILSSLINYESVLTLINWMTKRIQLRPFGLIFTYGGSSSAIIYLPFSGKANGRIIVFDSHGKVVDQRMACAVFDISLIRTPERYIANNNAIAQVARFVHQRIAYNATYTQNTPYVRDYGPEETTFSSFIVEW